MPLLNLDVRGGIGTWTVNTTVCFHETRILSHSSTVVGSPTIVFILYRYFQCPAFRRGWGAYESTYLFAKLSTLVIIAVIDSDNCLFRSHSRTLIPVIRQILLLLSTIAFFIAQCIFAPFLDPVNNASEWTSRLNYVTTSTTALLIALDVPGRDIIETYVLYRWVVFPLRSTSHIADGSLWQYLYCDIWTQLLWVGRLAGYMLFQYSFAP